MPPAMPLHASGGPTERCTESVQTIIISYHLIFLCFTLSSISQSDLRSRDSLDRTLESHQQASEALASRVAYKALAYLMQANCKVLPPILYSVQATCTLSLAVPAAR